MRQERLPEIRILYGVIQQRWRVYSEVDGVPREPYDEWRVIQEALDYPIDGPRHTQKETPRGR